MATSLNDAFLYGEGSVAGGAVPHFFGFFRLTGFGSDSGLAFGSSFGSGGGVGGATTFLASGFGSDFGLDGDVDVDVDVDVDWESGFGLLVVVEALLLGSTPLASLGSAFFDFGFDFDLGLGFFFSFGFLPM